MKECFVVEAHLDTPVIMGTTTLDALLGAVLFEKLGDVEKTHQAIPIVCTDGLFHASSVQKINPAYCAPKTFVAGLRATHDLKEEWVGRNSRGQLSPMGLTRRSDFGNVMNTYPSVFAPVLRWYAEGDPEHVLELLAPERFVGKRSRSGMGQVSRWEVNPVGCSLLNGLVDANNLPLRPIPWERWEKLGGAPDAVKADAAWKPAYWEPRHRAICAVPAKQVIEKPAPSAKGKRFTGEPS